MDSAHRFFITKTYVLDKIYKKYENLWGKKVLNKHKMKKVKAKTVVRFRGYLLKKKELIMYFAEVFFASHLKSNI